MQIYHKNGLKFIKLSNRKTRKIQEKCSEDPKTSHIIFPVFKKNLALKISIIWIQKHAKNPRKNGEKGTVYNLTTSTFTNHFKAFKSQTNTISQEASFIWRSPWKWHKIPPILGTEVPEDWMPIRLQWSRLTSRWCQCDDMGFSRSA